MNASVFTGMIAPVWNAQIPKDLGDAADYLSTAYHSANIGQSTTFFGAPLLNANKDVLKIFNELSFKINFYGGQAKSTISTITASLRAALNSGGQIIQLATNLITNAISSLVAGIPPQLAFIATAIRQVANGLLTQIQLPNIDKDAILQRIKKLEGLTDMLDTSKIAFLIMATGTCLYWLSSTMSPVPPMPPFIAPTVGTTILFPGVPGPLLDDLAKTFASPQSVLQAVSKLFNSYILHQFTIIGTYTGLIPFFPTPIAGPPLTWFGLLNVPFPSI